jgi:aminopeptidase
MPDSRELKVIGAVHRLMAGARNAVSNCLSADRTDSATLVCDQTSLNVAASIYAALEEKSIPCHAFVLERHATRPIEKLPKAIVDALNISTISLYTAHPVPGEYKHRAQLIGLVKPLRLRHAHMVRLSEDSMMQGMLSNYKRVARLNQLMISRINQAKTIHVTSPKGTDIWVTLDPKEEWESSAGEIGPGEWYNLPNGEIITCPAKVDGTFICNGIIPIEEKVDQFETGRLPLEIQLENSRLVDIKGGPPLLADSVKEVLLASKDLDRIGQFAVGTNFELLMTIGDSTQDMFVPGAYFSFGRSQTNANVSWTTNNSLPFSARRTTLELDGLPIISNGRYNHSLLALTR